MSSIRHTRSWPWRSAARAVPTMPMLGLCSAFGALDSCSPNGCIVQQLLGKHFSAQRAAWLWRAPVCLSRTIFPSIPAAPLQVRIYCSAPSAQTV